MHAKSLQLCLTLCDPMDGSLPGSSVHGIFQARILEWVAISLYIYKAALHGLSVRTMKRFSRAQSHAALGLSCLEDPGWFWVHPLKGQVDSCRHSLMCAENLVHSTWPICIPLISPRDGGWIEGILQMRKLRLVEVLCPREPQKVSRRSRTQPQSSPSTCS